MALTKITGEGIGAITGDVAVDGGTIKLDGNYPTASNNVALGNNALDDGSLSGNANTAIGSSSMTANTSGQKNVGLGESALLSNTTGSFNTALGQASLESNTTASNNTAVGYQAGSANTTGTRLTAIGHSSLKSNTTGVDNTAVGCIDASAQGTLQSNTTGTNNVAVGGGAIYTNTTGSNNTAVGYRALKANTTAGENTAVGQNSMISNTTGFANVACGASALYSNTTGLLNNCFGYTAGYHITTGSKNTILGAYNGNQGGLDIRTSSNHIVLSDGDGNPRVYYDPTARSNTGGLTSQNAFADMTASTSGTGFAFGIDGFHEFQRSGSVAARFGRLANDGNLIELVQAGVTEGTISVSGTTVSYNGGHLARWSRLLDNNKDTSIVKGTVMTNLDEMVEWGDEDNEQLNKMAVSSVEGDANVAGVFVNWDNDDNYNDMNVAMTGDMVIRIAQGTTVARGDLLMSAGDGTAKPQGDDIVRSKTIAKVTSTNVSHTYDDGTYLVPCVLMAC